MSIKLILFDMDGVIFEGNNFWLDLHHLYGTVKEGLELADKYLVSNYELLARSVAKELWKDKPASVYLSLINSRSYQPGVGELFAYLQEHDIYSAIVSSGPYHLALRAQRELGINEIWANRLILEDNLLSGEVDIMVSDTDKGRIGLEIMSRRGINPDVAASIGDTESDTQLAKIVRLSVAYNSQSERLNQLSTYVFRYGELWKFLDVLQKENKYL